MSERVSDSEAPRWRLAGVADRAAGRPGRAARYQAVLMPAVRAAGYFENRWECAFLPLYGGPPAFSPCVAVITIGW